MKMVSSLISFSVKKPLVVIIIIGIISVFFGFFALQVKIDPNIQGIIPEDDEVNKVIDKYMPNAKALDYIVITVENDNPFDLEKLRAFYSFLIELKAFKGIEQIISPFNIFSFIKDGKRLEIRNLTFDNFPQNDHELEAFKAQLTSNFIADRMVISKDKRILAAFLSTSLDIDHELFIMEFQKLLPSLQKYYDVRLTGTVPFTDAVKKYLKRDMPKLIVLGVFFILFIYYFSYKAFRAPFLTLIIVILGTVWCVGFMSLLGFTISVISIITPSLVLTLGSSYSIHILNQYFIEAPSESRELKSDKSWIIDAVQHVNMTVILASLTTVAGMFSLLAVTLVPIREFGIATGAGIAFCGLLSFFLLPALLSLLRNPSKKQKNRVSVGFIIRLMGILSRFIMKRRIYIFVIIALIGIAFFICYPKLKFKTDTVSYFPQREKLVKDTYWINQNVGGFQQINISLSMPDTESNNDYFLDQQRLLKIHDFEEQLLKNPNVTKIISFTNTLSGLNGLMNDEYGIPKTRGLTLLLSRFIKNVDSRNGMSEILNLIANKEFNRITIIVWVYNSATNSVLIDKDLSDFIFQINNYLESYELNTYKPEIWGESLRFLSVGQKMKRDQQISTILSFILVFIISVLAFRSVKFGILALLPLIFGIMINVIFMVLVNIPMDLTTIMFSIVVIGVGIDNSIHFLLQYKKQLALYGGDFRASLTHSLAITGRPIIVTTTSIVIGFLMLCFSTFRPIINFGFLVALALATSAFGTLVLIPAFLTISHGKTIRKRLNK